MIKKNFLLVDNSSEEIKFLALEIEKEINGKKIENEQDKVNQEKFWKVYMKYIDLEKMGTVRPKISPTFLRNNLDLLN